MASVKTAIMVLRCFFNGQIVVLKGLDHGINGLSQLPQFVFSVQSASVGMLALPDKLGHLNDRFKGRVMEPENRMPRIRARAMQAKTTSTITAWDSLTTLVMDYWAMAFIVD